MDELRKKSPYEEALIFWVNNLFERASRLFKWDGTGDDLTGGIDYQHIEKPLLLYGNVGVCKYNGELTAFCGSYSGVTKYYDRFPFFMVRSPVFSGKYTIGKDIVVIRNNSNETNLQTLVRRYAQMLAHAELTLVTLLVNARVSSVPTVNTNKEKALIDAWRDGVYNGKMGTVLDSGFLSVRWQDINLNSGINVLDCWDVRDNLLRAFYQDIGVKVVNEKRGNLINAEVGGNDSMLLININDMLEERKRGCDLVNAMFGTNWSVDKCEELKYMDAVQLDERGDDNGELYN